MGHRIFCCDGCQTHEFNGRRFHCLRCVNYDLCGDCYDQHTETLDHRLEHPMQLLLDHERNQQLPELLINGELLELMHLPNCYTCPYCGIFGHTAKELIDHVVSMHRQAENHVVCPMCAGLPGIELVAIRNLARHLLLNHIEHANLLDPNTPPLRHVTARISRRRRRQQPSSPINASSNNSRSSGRNNNSRMDSEAGIDILYQLSELRRLRPDMRTTHGPSNLLEGDTLTRTAALAIANTEALPNDQAVIGCAIDPCTSNPLQEHSDTDRYLLQHWMAEQRSDLEAALQDKSQRQNHALFTEHLLLSMLCDEQLQLPEEGRKSQELPQSEKNEEEEQSMESKKEDALSMKTCNYVPSQIMMLMSLPWIRPWSNQSKMRYIKLQGVTLGESHVNGVDEQDID